MLLPALPDELPGGDQPRASGGGRPPGPGASGIYRVAPATSLRKDSVQSEAEVRIWFADGVANGLRPWFTKFAGVLRDRRWQLGEFVDRGGSLVATYETSLHDEMKGPFRELIPIGEQRVVVRLPAATTARKVHLLVAERDLPIEQDGTRLTVAVPSVRDHEVVAIDF